MIASQVPAVFAAQRWHTADEVESTARQWRLAILDRLGDSPPLIAAAVPATAEGVSLAAALSALPMPVALLGPTAASWPTEGCPPGTPLILPASLAALASAAPQAGMRPLVLPTPGSHSTAPPFTPLSGAGWIFFTSGSTGAPRPVYRPFPALVAGIEARATALGLTRGLGAIIGVTLAHGQGMNMLTSAMLRGGPLAFLESVNHRQALSTIAMPEFECWRVTPHYADVLSRCALHLPPRAPRICLIAAPLPTPVFDRFLDRFGVPIRQGYSSTETGQVSVDDRPAADVRPGSVGRPLPGVEVCAGDDPSSPLPIDTDGPLWIRSPYTAQGVGLPPHIVPPPHHDGWRATHDLGRLTADGLVVLSGRADDTIRSHEGRLVNLAAVTDLITALPHVRAAIVVPLDAAAGRTFGAVLATDATGHSDLRHQVIQALPLWARPRRLVLVNALPLLPTGKPDRQACIARLQDPE